MKLECFFLQADADNEISFDANDIITNIEMVKVMQIQNFIPWLILDRTLNVNMKFYGPTVKKVFSTKGAWEIFKS